MTGRLVDAIPIWAIYPVTAVILVLGTLIGHWYAEARRRRAGTENEPLVGPIVGATLALLAFLLAFVVGFSVNVFQERRHLAIEEANAVAATYFRAGYLDEPYRTESRELLLEYADQRVAAIDENQLPDAITRSVEIQQELWARAQEIVRNGDHSDTTSEYVSSLVDVIELHDQRIAAGEVRVPPWILVTLYFIAFLSMLLVGLQSGHAKARSIVALAILILCLSAVLYLIMELDRAHEGLMQVPQRLILDLPGQLQPWP